ncbi:suppressor of tumorigenicity 14 protein isoform X2 [Rhinatrema bivittatum]|nr:suppressor of tumorigenicity 14 protein isoform X2 [Rhinatrema bivittatum]XP_029428653.1 suppressor of tumorigenicity 14 protein isoform X2 [Rhinatrema bivittatum]
MNGFEEGVEFLPAMNSKKMEKRGPKRWIVILAVVIGALLLSVMISLLVWHFKYRDVRVQKSYTGYLRITNVNFIDAYENSSSPEFSILAEKVKDLLKTLYLGNSDIGPYFKQCEVTAFSEGSVLAYYWAEFSVPKYREEAMEKAISQGMPTENVIGRRSHLLNIDSLVAYPADPKMAKDSRDKSCYFSLHTSPGVKTSFSTPGFPNSQYPNNAHCQWVLRADAGHVISLNFKTFAIQPCRQPPQDFVKVYNSLSPVEPYALVQLCGSYPPSYNLTFLSSQNVMLVSLISDATGRYPGFRAEFFQLPKTTLCGGTFRNASGIITTPYYPAHYPPDIDCIWDIQVPSDKNVKIRFNMFYIAEPGVSVSSCTKDYVEINKQRYCGELPQFVVASNTNKIEVRFHSDKSYSDTGFLAEYLSYEASNPCPNQFTCKTGQCISKALQCDGWNDCGDFSDELSCTCTEDQFQCKESKICQPKFWVCDTVNDCGDNSDELGCECAAEMLKCGNGKCIPLAQKCNSIDNCGDGTDEFNCGAVAPVNCKDYTYKCKNNQCINKNNPECDGKKDCTDGSDEENCSCGTRPITTKGRIVGGVNAYVGEWPWQVSLHTSIDGKHICGASVVSNKWLVSAAHCFQNAAGARYSDPSKWTAYLGLHDQNSLNSKNVVAVKIKRIIAHRDFNDYSYDYDIAVLELENAIQFSNTIQPICLPDATHNFPVGKSLWVTGWGATKEGGPGAAVLQKAEIRIINQTECNKILSGAVTPRMICAGYLSGGIDACQGDSGGPLSSVEANNRLYLTGVVSWGEGCARRDKPGLYTLVTTLRKWITDQTGL